MQADHNLLHGIHGTAEIGPLGAPGHHHDSQQVLAMNFSLARKLSDCCQRAESCGAAAAARQQGVANGFERSSVAFGESDAHRVYAIIGNYWRYCRFAFDQSGRIGRNFFRSKSSACGHDRINLE